MPVLDFALLDRPSFREMFVRLPTGIENAIGTLPETSARFEGAIKFCWYVSGTPDVLYTDEPKATRIREAFLRASLAEYVSVEDTLKRDLLKLGIKANAIEIIDLPNPLLHLMRELRNLEIHLTSSQLSKAEKAVTVTIFDAEHQSETTIWTVNDLTVEKFQELRFARKRYSKDETEKMVNWFNEAQYDWGVNDLLFRAIIEWASAIVKTYNLGGV
jgi:hypothetical protein